MRNRSTLQRLFLDHPASVGESYLEHAGVALRFGARMVAGGLACMAHGIIPALFTRTGSTTVKKLYGDMTARQPAFARSSAAHQNPDWQLEYEI